MSPLSRRAFFQIAGTGGAVLLLGVVARDLHIARITGRTAAGLERFDFGAFLRMDESGRVTVWISRSEMGQGVSTALPMLVAEELEIEWSAVSIALADLDARLGEQGTSGSFSMRTLWEPLRKAGASARQMLIAAAAARWNVPAAECRAAAGRVTHEPGRRAATYGELVREAALLPVPEDVPLKPPEQYRLLGRRLPRQGMRAIVRGAMEYGINVRVPGMLFASVEHPPQHGGRIAHLDDAAALALRGVRSVLVIEPSSPPQHRWGGVAVVAESTWAAFQGRRALRIEWTAPAGSAGDSSAQLDAALDRALLESGSVVRREGDAAAVLAHPAHCVEATYALPFLAHATMEPMNCTAHVTGDRCEVWAPTQSPGGVAGNVSRALGIARDHVTVHVVRMGGGFGRRSFPDVAVEAALISRHADVPVQVIGHARMTCATTTTGPRAVTDCGRQSTMRVA